MSAIDDTGDFAGHDVKKVKPPNTKVLGPTHDVLVAAEHGETALLVGGNEQLTR
jgi:hypothetical protein